MKRKEIVTEQAEKLSYREMLRRLEEYLASESQKINLNKLVGSFIQIEREIANNPFVHKETSALLLNAIKKYNAQRGNRKSYYPLTVMIHRAVFKNDLAAVIRYVEKDPRYLLQKNSSGETPLYVAYKLHHTKIAHFLLHETKDAHDANDLSGDTLLHLAVAEGNVDDVEKLLNKHALIFLPNNQGFTPLDIARREKNRTLIKLLEAHQAKLENNFYI